jgi:hypothetical protein
MNQTELNIFRAGQVIGQWMRPEYAGVMLPGSPMMTCDEFAPAVLGILYRKWLGMETAPRDGTVIEAVARLQTATAGFPQYIQFRDGHWLTTSYDTPRIVVPWAWRQRSDWPQEPSTGAAT